MTDLLERAIARPRVPPAAQDDFARVLPHLAGDATTPVALIESERIGIAMSKAAAARGDFATDERVRERIRAAIETLKAHPRIGRPTDDPTIRAMTSDAP
ncbi:hypothetical protein [Methylobacterium nonmethylotrophicum]|uniref:hypothetical protein n=1 Tax=Methylobacterium nonmethylotrophicum TaxID=1141884 RepID=UPI00197CB2D1|nr:hypothetical protein [Methylobacterium nonmethylotrophicum]